MKPSAKPSRNRARAGDRRRMEMEARAVLVRNPGDPESLHRIGALRYERGDLDGAVRFFEKAASSAPSVPKYLESLSTALLSKGDLDDAEREAILAQRLDEERSRPVLLLGMIAMERRDLRGAIRHFAQAASMEMPNLDATTNMAVALNRAGEWTRAEEWSRVALRIAPEHVPAWINLGLSLKAQRRLDEAKEAFRRAGADPRARFNLGYVHMLEGDLRRGLPLLEERKRLLGIGRNLATPEWDGSPRPKARLLVVHEQGMGDTLLMCRFFPTLVERFESVTVLVQPPLQRLMAACFPGVEFVDTREGARYDRWCAAMSLPGLLGIDSVERIPLEPWLRVQGRARRMGDREDRRLRIGLNWAGNPKFAYDAIRSAHLADVSILLAAPDVAWVSLHRGHLEHEADSAGLPQPLREARDFLDTAEAIAELDLVISTETAIPNLSAAMGVPTLVLASPDWDWRWAHWYPGVTVCAQQRPGDWMSACVRALEAIREEMVRRNGEASRAA